MEFFSKYIAAARIAFYGCVCRDRQKDEVSGCFHEPPMDLSLISCWAWVDSDLYMTTSAYRNMCALTTDLWYFYHEFCGYARSYPAHHLIVPVHEQSSWHCLEFYNTGSFHLFDLLLFFQIFARRSSFIWSHINVSATCWNQISAKYHRPFWCQPSCSGWVRVKIFPKHHTGSILPSCFQTATLTGFIKKFIFRLSPYIIL